MAVCSRCNTTTRFWNSFTFETQTNRCRRCEDAVRRLFEPAQTTFQTATSCISLAQITQIQRTLLHNHAPLAEAPRYLGTSVDSYLCQLFDGNFGKIDPFVTYMRQLRQILGLTNMPGHFYDRFVANTRHFGDLENLPHLAHASSLRLDPGEQCYLSPYPATQLRERQSGLHTIPGQLILTDRRLIFAAHGTSGDHELPLRRISATHVHSQRLTIEIPTTRATWRGQNTNARRYGVAEPLVLATLLDRIRITAAPGTARSRHIPQHVREKVFQRDGGRCVLCGSATDIHYDHLIPFSKGGAHTVENIRILCQQCNLRRGNRIGD